MYLKKQIIFEIFPEVLKMWSECIDISDGIYMGGESFYSENLSKERWCIEERISNDIEKSFVCWLIFKVLNFKAREVLHIGITEIHPYDITLNELKDAFALEQNFIFKVYLKFIKWKYIK